MTKKIMAMLLIVTMVISLGAVTGSAEGTPSTVKEVIYAYGESIGLDESGVNAWLSRTIMVPTDVKLREEGSADFVDGPITVKEKTTGNISTFDYQATLDMTKVREAFEDYTAAANRVIASSNVDDAGKEALYAELGSMPVRGSFTIKIVVPESNFEIPEYITESGNMAGFNDAAKKIFHEVSRTIEENVITIEIGVGGTATANSDYATKAELAANLGEDLVFECDGIQPKEFGTYKTMGYISGQTVIGDGIATISYKTEAMPEIGTIDGQDAPAATLTVSKKSSSATSSSSSSSSGTVTVSFVVDGKVIETVSGKDGVNVALSDIDPGEKEGYTFEGWYTDEALTVPFTEETKVTADLKLYAKWTENADTPDTPDVKISFKDVSENDWFYDSVNYVCENKLFFGVTEDEFAPNSALTRAMLVTVLYRAEGEPAVNKSIPFADVDGGSYYENAVIWAQQNGIVNGITENEFAPNENITREQIAAIMFRYAKYKGYDVSVGENTNILSYTDAESISDYATSAMQYAAGSGLMKGRSDTTINPLDNATRAEVAAILQRFIESNK